MYSQIHSELRYASDSEVLVNKKMVALTIYRVKDKTS